MRHTIAYENVDHGWGYVIAPGALKFPEGEVPVTWNFDQSNPESVWGKAFDFRRDGNGHITAEIKFDDDKIDNIKKIQDDVGATFWAQNVNRDVNLGMDTIVRAADIRAVSLVVKIPWRLTKEEEDGSTDSIGTESG